MKSVIWITETHGLNTLGPFDYEKLEIKYHPLEISRIMFPRANTIEMTQGMSDTSTHPTVTCSDGGQKQDLPNDLNYMVETNI